MKKNVKNKRPPGRPKTENPASEKLPVVRVTPDKLSEYRNAATKSGKTFSAWVREWLDEGAKQ